MRTKIAIIIVVGALCFFGGVATAPILFAPESEFGGASAPECADCPSVQERVVCGGFSSEEEWRRGAVEWAQASRVAVESALNLTGHLAVIGKNIAEARAEGKTSEATNEEESLMVAGMFRAVEYLFEARTSAEATEGWLMDCWKVEGLKPPVITDMFGQELPAIE